MSLDPNSWFWVASWLSLAPSSFRLRAAGFGVLDAGDVLLAGLFDVVHRGGDGIHAGVELLEGHRDLGCGLRGDVDVLGEHTDRAV